MISRMI